MPRPPRLDYPSARHHVMNRGARRAPIFADAENCYSFLQLLGELTRRYGVVVHGYALLPNHFHLLLQTPHANLSRAMAYLTGQYSRELNRRYEWDGPLFRARFKNRVIEDEDYWRDLLAYLHLNPVRAGLATSPDGADWTSHAEYVGLSKRPPWLTCEEMLGLYGSLDAYRTRLHDIASGAVETIPDWDVVAWKETVVSTRVAPSSEPSPRLAIPPEAAFERAVDEVSRVTDRSREALLTSRRGRPSNTARWVLAWWLTRPGRLSTTEAARALEIAASGVSRMVTLVVSQRDEDEEIQGWMTALEGLADG